MNVNLKINSVSIKLILSIDAISESIIFMKDIYLFGVHFIFYILIF